MRYEYMDKKFSRKKGILYILNIYTLHKNASIQVNLLKRANRGFPEFYY